MRGDTSQSLNIVGCYNLHVGECATKMSLVDDHSARLGHSRNTVDPDPLVLCVCKEQSIGQVRLIGLPSASGTQMASQKKRTVTGFDGDPFGTWITRALGVE
jgi:hypothetical protein